MTCCKMKEINYTYVDILHDVDFFSVLSERPNANTMTAVTTQILYQNTSAIRFEADAIIKVIYIGVLNDDVGASISIPP